MLELNKSGMKTRITIISVILTVAVIFQISNLFIGIRKDISEIWRDRGRSAIWRGARFGQGQRFADFVLFILAKVPSDGLVILPPNGVGPRSLSTTV